MTAKTANVRPKAVVLAALAMMLGLAASASPAAALTEVGAGVVTGTEQPAAQTDLAPPLPPTIPPTLPLFCGKVTPKAGAVLYDLEGQGTYTSDGTSGKVIYRTAGAMPLDIKVKANSETRSYYIAPEGTYTNPDCVRSQAPGQEGIPVDVSVQASTEVRDSAGGPCDGSGTFRRVNTAVVFEWELTEACRVRGNVLLGSGAAPVGTWHSIEGHLTPCFQDPFTGIVDTCASPQEQFQVVGSYQETLH